MPYVVEHCSAYFCCNCLGNGVLLVAKSFAMVWPTAAVCLLQGQTALHFAAARGHVHVTETLLLNGADPEARDKEVRYGSLYNN